MSTWEGVLVFQTFAHHDGIEVLLCLTQVTVSLNGIPNYDTFNAVRYFFVGRDFTTCSGGFASLGLELLLLLNLLRSWLRRSSIWHNGAGPCFTESLGQFRKSNAT